MGHNTPAARCGRGMVRQTRAPEPKLAPYRALNAGIAGATHYVHDHRCCVPEGEGVAGN